LAENREDGGNHCVAFIFTNGPVLQALYAERNTPRRIKTNLPWTGEVYQFVNLTISFMDQ